MDKQVKLTVQEARKFEIVQRLGRGEITTSQASELAGCGERQIRRLLVAVRDRGAGSLAHGNRGRAPANAIPQDVRAKILELSDTQYQSFNDRHFRDMLECEHGIRLSPSSVRRVRRQAGKSPTKTRRPPKKNKRRDRKPQAGMMLQIDGSPFAWLGADQPTITLLIAIDDASSEVFAVFRPTEDCFGYLWLLRSVIQTRGIPESIYSDRHSIFAAPKKNEEIDQQLRGETKPTQLGRVAQELGIRSIQAKSPQAKGRVERAFGTLQDRLTNELVLHNITTLEEANAFLPAFLERHNKEFSCAPQNPTPAWRKPPARNDLRNLFAFQFDRVVKNDHTVSFAGACLDLRPRTAGSIAKKTIQVRVNLEGCISYWLNGKILGTGPTLTGEPSPDIKHLGELLRQIPQANTPDKPKSAVTTAPRRPEQNGTKPAPDHPWRRFSYGRRRRGVVPSPASDGG
jgi:transposase